MSSFNVFFRGRSLTKLCSIRVRNKNNVAFFVLLLVIIFLNQHFTRFVVWFPLILLMIGWSAVKEELRQSNRVPFLPKQLLLAVVFYVVSIVLASLVSPFRVDAINELMRTILGPLLIVFVAMAVDWREKLVRRLFFALCMGGWGLAVTDLLHYVRDIISLGYIPHDFSHRWFSDGYIFYLPFILLARNNCLTWCKHLLNACLFLFFLLVAGTGSRATWLTILLEILMLLGLNRSGQYLFDLFSFIFSIYLGLQIFPHETGMATVERGLSDNNRLQGYWFPALLMSINSIKSLMIGHGYGREVWGFYHAHCQECSFEGPGLGGPHNVFLQALFAGGLFSIISLCWILFSVLQLLVSFMRDSSCRQQLAQSALVSLVGFFLVRGLVEDSRPEPMAIYLLIASILFRRNRLMRN